MTSRLELRQFSAADFIRQYDQYRLNGLQRLVGRVMAENLASIHTLQRIGFIVSPRKFDTEIWCHFYLELDQVAASTSDGVRIV